MKKTCEALQNVFFSIFNLIKFKFEIVKMTHSLKKSGETVWRNSIIRENIQNM